MGRELSRDLGYEVPVEGIMRRDCETDARFAVADLPRERGSDCAGSSQSGPRADANECAAATGSNQVQYMGASDTMIRPVFRFAVGY